MNSIYDIATCLNGIKGELNPGEANALVALAAGRDCLEVGSFCGLSSFCIAVTAEHLTCVDHFQPSDNEKWNADVLPAFKHNMRKFRNFDAYIMSSAAAVKQIPTGTMYDFVFIDADHDYDNVRLNRNEWWPHLRVAGVMVFHDYDEKDFPGVYQLVNETFVKPNVVETLAWDYKKNGSGVFPI